MNQVRIGNLGNNSIALLDSKIINSQGKNYPTKALHIYTQNEPANTHNFYMINSVTGKMYIIPSIDKFPQDTANIRINEALKRNQSETGGLAQALQLKFNARVMLTVNIEIEDRLVNG